MAQTSSKTNKATDIAVVGAGLVGLTAALAAVRRGADVVLIAPDLDEPDGRTSALLGASVTFLQTLDIWPKLQPRAYPLKIMRIVDGTKRLFRAPQTDFNSGEIGLTEFGFNLENNFMADVLRRELSNSKNFTRISAKATGIELDDAGDANEAIKAIHTDAGTTIVPKLVFASDGRQSIIRKNLGIDERSWDYPQIAMVGNFTHTLPHNDTSTEFHTETGPCTVVPLGDMRSSLVYVVDVATANHLKSMTNSQIDLALEQRMASVLGKVKMEGPLKSFPLSAMLASQFSKGNCLIGGEAGHVFPPIGAQGLNLGLRDVATFDQLISEYETDEYADIARLYQRSRERDINTRTFSVDLLNRSLLSDLLPVQMTRSLGLFTLGAFGPLRRAMMREGTAQRQIHKSVS